MVSCIFLSIICPCLGVLNVALSNVGVGAELGLNGVGGLEVGQAQRVTLGQLGHATVIVSYDPKDCQVKTITLFYLFSFKPGLRQVLIQMSESRVI